MGNPISDEVATGTIGELLVQLRLLQFGVQAAPPIKDSGNDLIAVRGEAFRGVQVKTTTKGTFRIQKLPRYYHLLALVDLRGEDEDVYLDSSVVYLIPRTVIEERGLPKDLSEFRLCRNLIDALFDANWKL